MSLLLNRLDIAIAAHRVMAQFISRKTPGTRLEIAIARELKKQMCG